MPKADKKQRRKIKRDAKRKEFRRRNAVSPIKRLADAHGEVEYWMSDGFEGFHQAQVFVYKRGGGLSGVACFLVDKGVVGLKDAWTRVNIDREEFRDFIDQSDSQGIPMRQATLEEAKNLVAGAIRWTHDNGMRLPKDWPRAALLLGGITDWMSADVSRFSKEFMGHPEDLRQRLIGESFESYIRRPDITFLFSNDAPYSGSGTRRDADYLDAQSTDDEFEEDEPAATDEEREAFNDMMEGLAPIAITLADATSAWVASRGQTPAPFLREVWQTMMATAAIAQLSNLDQSESDPQPSSYELFDDALERGGIAERPELQQALDQISDHVEAEPEIMNQTLEKLRDSPE